MRPNNVLKWLIVGLCVTALCVGGASAWYIDDDDGTMYFGYEDNGDTVDVPEYTCCILMLYENPTIGFRVDLSATDGLEMTDLGYFESDENKKDDGGLHAWFFVADKLGDHQITGVSTHPWNSNGHSITYTLNLNVYED